jgi:hypothetical protein
MTSSWFEPDSKAFLISSIGAAKLEATATLSLSAYAAEDRFITNIATSVYLLAVINLGNTVVYLFI